MNIVLRAGLCVLLIAGTGLLAFGLRSAIWPVADGRNVPPRLACVEEIDLGDRDRGDIAVTPFVVRNEGGGTLTLDGFQTSCSCAGVERVVDGSFVRVRSLELAVGERAELYVRVAVGAPSGEPQLVRVYFNTSDPDRPSHSMQVLIPRVRGGVTCRPTAIVFGTVPVGENVVRVVDLFDTGVSGRRVGEIKCRPAGRFEVRLLPTEDTAPTELHPAAGRRIARLEVKANSIKPGTLAGEIELHVAGENRAPDVLAVVGDVVGPLTCSPEQLFLPIRTPDGDRYEGRVVISSRDQATIHVTLVSAPKGVSASIKPTPDAEHQCELLVTTTPEPGILATQDRVFRISVAVTHGKERAVLEIPVTVFGSVR